MLSTFANIATVVFFIALYVYIAAEVMMGGGSAAAMAWKVVVPSLGAAGGFRVLAWLFAPRASASRRRAQLLRARR
jgi:C4-dicarboxylate transporter